MTFGEFKSWLEGYTENLRGGVPSAKQWKRIQERMGEVTTEPAHYCGCRPTWWPSWYTFTIQNGSADPMPKLPQTWCNTTNGSSISVNPNADPIEMVYNANAFEIGQLEAQSS